VGEQSVVGVFFFLALVYGGEAIASRKKLEEHKFWHMAARRLPPSATADVATTMSKDVVVAGTGTLKRKRTTPPASPVPSKKPPRENLARAAAESPPIIIIPLAPNGEPVEVVPGKGESIATDHHVIKQRIGQPHVSVRVVLNAEEAIQSGVDREPSDELKKATPYLENISHGQLQVKSVPVSGGGGGGGGSQQASFLNPRKRVGADPAGFGTPSPSAPPASQVPPSVVVGPTAVMRMPSSEAVSHAIPSHAGETGYLRLFSIGFKSALHIDPPRLWVMFIFTVFFSFLSQVGSHGQRYTTWRGGVFRNFSQESCRQRHQRCIRSSEM
jgi:hypothetical protein